MASQNPSNNTNSDDLDQSLDIAMAHIEGTSGFTADDASEYSDAMTTTGSLYSRNSTGSMPQDYCYSTKQTQTDDDTESRDITPDLIDDDTVQSLDVTPDLTDHFHITILHIKKNKEYQLEVEASTTVKELAWIVQHEELAPIRILNLLQHGVVRIFGGDEDDEKSQFTLGDLGVEDGDRINVVLKDQVAVFPRSAWYQTEDGSIKLGDNARQQLMDILAQGEEPEKDFRRASVNTIG
ncbi:hypothetical protein PRZ48_008623 [Zasmidium cellare]|uniref:Ubiquitin-like domain-containing protein n=1 Tax=Zasmidium cellare TaxID=395010 RepID=A0ABR0EFZ4_ZASCE|nr:hypothetical protein PRZ48_008623 [Zasmidium cellare]